MAKEFITEVEAAELLRLNTRNRHVSEGHVAMLADDMAAGRWRYNGEAIRISSQPDLLDGQHRLHAIIMAAQLNPDFRGVEIEVLRDIDPEVRETIDIGRRRSFADVHHMLGGKNGVLLGSVVRLVINYLEGARLYANQSTPTKLAFLKKHPAVADYTGMAAYLKQAVVLPSVLGAVAFLASRDNLTATVVEDFLSPIQRGEGLIEGDARLALRNSFLTQRLRSTTSTHVRPDWGFAAAAAAWNGWVTGRRMQNLRVTTNERGVIEPPNIIGGPAFGAGDEQADVPRPLITEARNFIARYRATRLHIQGHESEGAQA